MGSCLKKAAPFFNYKTNCNIVFTAKYLTYDYLELTTVIDVHIKIRVLSRPNETTFSG